MIVYELRHTMYIWEDCATEVNTLLFETEKDAIEYLYNRYGDSIFISIMSQYTPCTDLSDYPEINRKLTQEEYDDVVDFAVEIGVENGFLQEGESASESFIPPFDLEGVE